MESTLPETGAPKKSALKKTLATALIISLIASALVAISVFLGGSFDETELKLLFTTLAIGIYSLTGLSGSVLYEKRRFVPVALASMAISGVGLIFTLLTIWEIFDIDDVYKSVFILFILAFSSAHAALLLVIENTKPLVRFSLFFTLFFIALVALMLIRFVLDGFNTHSQFSMRLIGVFAVLDVLGSIVTPILKKSDLG